MELKSANSGANWHPLTSLITFESLEEHRVHYFIPIVDGTLDYHSTLLHEITHLTSARFGRLGLYLARAAGREFAKWQRDRSSELSLNKSERRVIGTYVPLLEGLAIYSQLDFVAQENEGPHYSPLYLIANMSMSDHSIGKNLPERFMTWRWGAMAGEDTSLLEGLLLDGSREDLSYYTFGYFYIKALQEFWARRCSAFARPAVFLPFALKLLTEHPVLINTGLESMTTEEIFTAIHRTMIGLSADDLAFLDGLFSGRQTLSDFDHCNIYRQLETRRIDQIWSHDENFFKPFTDNLDDETSTWMGVFRACTAVYIYSWCEGLLKIPDKSPYNIVLEAPDGTAQAHLIPHAAIWRSAWEESIRNEPDKEMQSLRVAVGNELLQMEMDFFRTLAASEGKRVCLAGFMTVFRSIPGLCLWIDGQYVDSLISEPWHFLDIVKAGGAGEEEMTLLGAGLRIPPTDRVAFANAFADNEAVARQTRACGEHLLTYLVSEPEARFLLRQRLAGVWKDNLAEARLWAKGVPRPYPLPGPLRDKAEDIFDLPGFTLDVGAPKISFRRLLPVGFVPAR